MTRPWISFYSFFQMQEIWISLDCKSNSFGVLKTKPRYIRDICLTVVVSIDNIFGWKWHSLILLVLQWTCVGLSNSMNLYEVYLIAHDNTMHETTRAKPILNFFRNLNTHANQFGASMHATLRSCTLQSLCDKTMHRRILPRHSHATYENHATS